MYSINPVKYDFFQNEINLFVGNIENPAIIELIGNINKYSRTIFENVFTFAVIAQPFLKQE